MLMKRIVLSILLGFGTLSAGEITIAVESLHDLNYIDGSGTKEIRSFAVGVNAE